MFYRPATFINSGGRWYFLLSLSFFIIDRQPLRKIGYEAKMWTMEGWNEWIFMRERWVVFAFGFCFNAKRISYLSRCARFYIRTRFALLPLSRAAASTRVKCSAIWCKRLVAVYIILIVINWRRLAVARSWNIYIKLLTLCVFLNFRLRVLFFFFLMKEVNLNASASVCICSVRDLAYLEATN